MNIFKIIKILFITIIDIKNKMKFRKRNLITYDKLLQLLDDKQNEMKKYCKSPDSINYLNSIVYRYIVFTYNNNRLIIPEVQSCLYSSTSKYYVSLLDYIHYGNILKTKTKYFNLILDYINITEPKLIQSFTMWSFLLISLMIIFNSYIKLSFILAFFAIYLSVEVIIIIIELMMIYLKRKICILIKDIETYNSFVSDTDFSFPLPITDGNGYFELFDSIHDITAEYDENYKLLDTISEYIQNNKELYT